MSRRLSEFRVDWGIFRAAAKAWSEHNAQRLGAALACYSILSVAPLLLILVSISGLVLARNAIQGEIYWQIRAVAGSQVAAFIQELLNGMANHATTGIAAGVLGFIMWLVGASAVFLELYDDLNYIWDIRIPQGSTIGDVVRNRLFAFGLVIGTGLLFTLSLAANVAIQTAEKYVLGIVNIPAAVFATANFLASFFAPVVLFGLIYTVLPARRVAWTDAAVGSLITAVLFAIGKWLVGLYLISAGVGSLYGAAGSVVILLVWVYYSAQIFLLGAEFTHVYSERYGAIREDRDGLEKTVAARSAALQKPRATNSPAPPAIPGYRGL